MMNAFKLSYPFEPVTIMLLFTMLNPKFRTLEIKFRTHENLIVFLAFEFKQILYLVHLFREIL